MLSPAPPAVFQGIAFGLLFAAFSWISDAIEGTVPPWPRSALTYGGAAVVGGVLYGLVWRWLERRYAHRR